MYRDYALNLQLLPSLLTTLLLATLSLYAWTRRRVPGVAAFMIGSLLAAMWSSGSAMEYAALDAEAKLFWVRFQAFWQLPAASAMTCFVLEYTWPGRGLTRRNLVLLSIIPALDIALMLTNPFNQLGWREFAIEGEAIIQLYSPIAWFFNAYVIGLGMVNFLAFTWLFVRSPLQRWPVAIMLLGQVSGRALVMLDVSGVLRWKLPLDVMGMAVIFLAYAVALFGFHFFDPIAVARHRAIEQLQTGMLVIDPQETIISANPAAERMLGAPARQLKHQRIRDLLPAYPDGNLAESSGTEVEFRRRDGQGDSYYTLQISALRDWRGMQIGQLLMLRDVTKQRQNQAQIIEQQKALATLQERERLARELHDSLGQTLAAAHLQASTARMLLAEGDITKTDQCLEQVAQMTVAAEADMRAYLMGVRTTFSDELPFFSALRQYIQRFSQQYQVVIQLSVPPVLENAGLGTAVELQLFRIIQEALSNVRRHAQAKSVEILFEAHGKLLNISIVDDGQGFDPAAPAARQPEGFGMHSMRERAQALGGCLDVESQPGRGTRVQIELPMRDSGKTC